MAATGTAELEKVVRKVLDEQLGDDSEATLKGIQRVTRLLTDQVIPKLPDGPEEEEPPESTPEQPGLRGLSMRGATPVPGKPPGRPSPGKPGTPNVPDAPDGELPEGATAALEALCSSLSPEQFGALANFFTAIGEEPEEDEGDTEGGMALSSALRGDALTKLEASKPDEFEAAIEALTPFVAEDDDGGLSLAAPKRIVSGLDKGVYAALRESIDDTNEMIRGTAPGAIGVRGKPGWWKPLLRVLRVMGKALPWFKYGCAVYVVAKNQGKYPGDPPEGRWLKAAARNVIKSCL